MLTFTLLCEKNTVYLTGITVAQIKYVLLIQLHAKHGDDHQIQEQAAPQPAAAHTGAGNQAM